MDENRLKSIKTKAQATTAGPWSVNGKTGAGWRIDSLGTECVGLEFVNGWVAIVQLRDDAEFAAAMSPDVVIEMVEDIERLVADRDSQQRTAIQAADDLVEARAEISAYQGKPEGALPGWEVDDYGDYSRDYGAGRTACVYDNGDGAIVQAYLRDENINTDVDDYDIHIDLPDDATWRQGMRTVEEAAKARGWP